MQRTYECRDEYFVPSGLPYESPVQNWTDLAHPINMMTQEAIDEIMEHWLDKGDTDGLFSVYGGDDVGDTGGVPVYLDRNVPPYNSAHPLVMVPKRLRANWELDPWEGHNKVMVKRHLIVWRHQNDGAGLPMGLRISHTHHDCRVLRMVAESIPLRRSRRSCHRYEWYLHDDAAGNPLCPHRMYWPCT